MATDLRRERDAIRSEMERIVRQMQELETQVDNKSPDTEQKRVQLNNLRSELAELRGRMRKVMDASQQLAAVAPSPAPSYPRADNSMYSSYVVSAGSVLAQHRAPSPHAFGSGYVPDSGAMPRHDFDGRQVTESNGTRLPFSKMSTRGEMLMQQLRQRQAAEKDEFQQEVARLMSSMEQRHKAEEDSLLQRCHVEAERLREYEAGKLQMERAQRELESLHSQPSILDDPRYAGAPEVGTLRNYKASVY